MGEVDVMDPHDLFRFEPVGLNCETGFVLHKLGDQRVSLFKWNWVEPRSLISLLQKRFEGFFNFENLVPDWDDMVRDSAFSGCRFHTAMLSKSPTGRVSDRAFVLDAHKLRSLHRIEKMRIEKEIEDFHRRLSEGGKICILKDVSVTEAIAQEALDAIDEYSGNKTNVILTVTAATPESHGPATLLQVRPRILDGRVTRITEVHETNQAEYAEWRSLLTQACVA